MTRFAHLTGDVKAWAKRLVDDLNRQSGALPGPFADDAGAEAGGVAVNDLYRVAGGSIAWRQA